MPLYDYRCSKLCGHTRVEKHSMKECDTAEFYCNDCGALMERWYPPVDAISIAFMTPEALGRKKAPSDFRNFLSAIKKAHDRPGQSCGIKDH